MSALNLVVNIISIGDNGANDGAPGLTVDSGDVIYNAMNVIIPLITEKLLLVSITMYYILFFFLSFFFFFKCFFFIFFYF